MIGSLLSKITSSVLIVLLIATPLLAQNTTNDYLQGKLDGEQMAKGEPIWFFSGCLLGGIGIILPYVFEPSVPMDYLLGKSDAYISGFMDGYRTKAKQKNFKYAIYGCATSTVLYVVLCVVMLASIDNLEEDDEYYY